MIRRDYLLRMLAEFLAVLSRIRSLQKGQLWDEAQKLTSGELHQLTGTSPRELLELSETELLARLIRGENTLAVREKTLIVTTLLKEAGDIAAGRANESEAAAYYLKGLNLLLGVLAREEMSDFPEFVPRVETFLQGLANASLPLATQALLMQHYERSGSFAKAEDALFGILEQQPQNRDVLEFGAAFYHRLQGKSDDALIAGNLPRPEVQAGLAQLEARRAESRS
ncbi:MAG TPA: DUF6483 family protein [Verrucomicrobiae bacterium]|nr:DUF6483 family protein [Verrucomicrobiae bacterium]